MSSTEAVGLSSVACHGAVAGFVLSRRREPATPLSREAKQTDNLCGWTDSYVPPVMHSSARRSFRYGLAFGSVAVATGLGLLADRWDLAESIFTFFILAVALTSWYGGPAPSIIAAVLGALVFNYFFTEPLYQLAWTREDFAYFSVFAVLCGILIGLAWCDGALRRRCGGRKMNWRSRSLTDAELRERADRLRLTHDTVSCAT